MKCISPLCNNSIFINVNFFTLYNCTLKRQLSLTHIMFINFIFFSCHRREATWNDKKKLEQWKFENLLCIADVFYCENFFTHLSAHPISHHAENLTKTKLINCLLLSMLCFVIFQFVLWNFKLSKTYKSSFCSLHVVNVGLGKKKSIPNAPQYDGYFVFSFSQCCYSNWIFIIVFLFFFFWNWIRKIVRMGKISQLNDGMIQKHKTLIRCNKSSFSLFSHLQTHILQQSEQNATFFKQKSIFFR